MGKSTDFHSGTPTYQKEEFKVSDVNTNVETFPAGVFDLRGKTFYGPNGVAIPYEEMASTSLMTACFRQGKHVFSNEAVSKVSAEKKRRRDNGLEPMTDQEEADKLADSLAHYRTMWTTEGGWMPERSEGGQQPSEDRIDYWRRIVGEKETEAMLKAQSFKKAPAVKGEEVKYIQVGKDGKPVAFELSKWVAVYLNHSVHGPARKAVVEEKAQIAYAKELADKAAEKAAKEERLRAAQSMPILEIEIDEAAAE